MGGCGTPENPEWSCICLAGLLGFSLLCLAPIFWSPPTLRDRWVHSRIGRLSLQACGPF